MLCEILTYNIHGLPWSKDESKSICEWIKSIRPSIVCLQEAFTERIRKYFKEQLAREGYTVLEPRDSDVSILSSGLLFAVLDRDYHVISDCFCPYLDYHNVECFSNKGFHVVRLYNKREKRFITIVNTHTQSDTEVSWWFGKQKIHNIRRKQFQQILDFLTDSAPALVVGDLNCEHSPHPHLRFLSPHSSAVLRKRTFYSTGEDLDHIAWLPLQWANPNCAFCDIQRNGPRMESCKVLQKPWSDHAPVLATVYVPEKPKPK